MPMLEDFMTSQEAAEKLKLTTRQITGLCSRGELKGSIKHGGIWLIPKTSVDIYRLTKKREHYQRKENEAS